jgi:hypothetical protein
MVSAVERRSGRRRNEFRARAGCKPRSWSWRKRARSRFRSLRIRRSGNWESTQPIPNTRSRKSLALGAETVARWWRLKPAPYSVVNCLDTVETIWSPYSARVSCRISRRIRSRFASSAARAPHSPTLRRAASMNARMSAAASGRYGDAFEA